MRALRDRGLTLKMETTTVEILINGNFQTNRLAWAGAATFPRRACSSGLCVVAFRKRGHDPRHSARSANLISIVYASRFHGEGRSCTPITVRTTSTVDFRTTRTARTRGCSRPSGFRGATRPGRTRRAAGSAWRYRTGRTHRRHGCHGICGTTWRDGRNRIHWVDRQRRRTRTGRADRTHRTQRSAGSNRTDRRYGICRTTRTPWPYGRYGIRGTSRAGGRRRIRRTSRTQRRNRRDGKRGGCRAPGRKRCRGKRGPQGRNRRGWPVGLGWSRRRDRGCRSGWP
jgi:hypothetical protein